MYNQLVKRLHRMAIQRPLVSVPSLQWGTVESWGAEPKGFLFSSRTVRILAKQRTMSRWPTRKGIRCETTNRSVSALIERLTQANQIVTRRCWFPDESIPHGHLGCTRQKRYTAGDCDYQSPGVAMEKQMKSRYTKEQAA